MMTDAPLDPARYPAIVWLLAAPELSGDQAIRQKLPRLADEVRALAAERDRARDEERVAASAVRQLLLNVAGDLTALSLNQAIFKLEVIRRVVRTAARGGSDPEAEE